MRTYVRVEIIAEYSDEELGSAWFMRPRIENELNSIGLNLKELKLIDAVSGEPLDHWSVKTDDGWEERKKDGIF